MKLPEVQTRNKIRDGKICLMFLNGAEKEEISAKFKISVRQIGRVLYKNSAVLKKALELTKDQEKVNRIMFLKKQMRLSKKFDMDLEFSPLTLNDELKKELEGDLSSGRGGETHIVIIRPDNNRIDNNRIDNGSPTITISRPLSLQS